MAGIKKRWFCPKTSVSDNQYTLSITIFTKFKHADGTFYRLQRKIAKKARKLAIKNQNKMNAPFRCQL